MNQSLSGLIKKARESKNLTQTAFGKLFEPLKAQSTIARWEKGDLSPNRKHFSKIASILNISLEEFCKLTGEQLSEEEIIVLGNYGRIYVPNKRHLNAVNKGVKSWNRWRERNYRVKPQLAGAKPIGNYLDEIDLHGANLRGSTFIDKSLIASNFRGSMLSGANLNNADFRNADLSGADLCGANLTNANFANANLRGANLSGSILVNATLYDSNLCRANLSKADLTFADIRGANLNQANLQYAILKYCFVYGISSWDINLNQAVQKQLSICPNKVEPIYVDCIENARIKLLEINHLNDTKVFESAKNLQNALSENRVSVIIQASG